MTARDQSHPDGGSSLKRALGKLDATGLTVGTIVGAGIFASMGPAAQRAGGGLLLTIALAGIVALCTGLGGAQCGTSFAQPGGAFTWSRSVGLPTTGFIAGCCFLGKEIVGMSVLVITAAVVATFAVLIGGVLASSRVSLAMSNNHELPPWLSAIHRKHKVPHRAVLTIGLLVAALRLHENQRFYWRGLSWIGLAGCAVFLVMLPLRGLVSAGGALLLLLILRRFWPRSPASGTNQAG